MKELRTMINNTSLTKTQKMIAKYVLDNFADACFMTSTEIAMKLGVSESSVIRFSRSLGYDGFYHRSFTAHCKTGKAYKYCRLHQPPF